MASQLLAPRHPAHRPGHVAFKADANAYLSSVETQMRRGVWIDPLGRQILFARLGGGVASDDRRPPPSSRVRDLGYLERYLLPRFGIDRARATSAT